MTNSKTYGTTVKFLLMLCCFLGLTTVLWGNVGVFRGSGQTPRLETSSDIQMVEEEVVMVPLRGNYPVDTSGRNLDQMKYFCKFKFRNLSDEIVTVPMGFPLSTDAVWFNKPEDINQTKVIARFGFVAGTKDTTFPVRYVPYDKDKKFSSIFLWEMIFQPKQEIELFVQYTMGGYMGLASTQKETKRSEQVHYAHNYLNIFDAAIGQGHMYVTGTGGCWAGKIEKAVFKLYPFEFEEYLKLRGAWEETSTGKEKRLAALQKKRGIQRMLLTPDSKMVRHWLPERNEWKEVADKNGRNRHLELSYEPFSPGEKDSIRMFYIFPAMPTTATQFGQLLSAVKEKMAKEYARRDETMARYEKMKNENPQQYEKLKRRLYDPEPYTRAVEKNLADVILEFHGIRVGNQEIQDFLEAQCWFPVEEAPQLSPELKMLLESVSRGEASPIETKE